jgi:hypothetical protein
MSIRYMAALEKERKAEGLEVLWGLRGRELLALIWIDHGCPHCGGDV